MEIQRVTAQAVAVYASEVLTLAMDFVLTIESGLTELTTTISSDEVGSALNDDGTRKEEGHVAAPTERRQPTTDEINAFVDEVADRLDELDDSIQKYGDELMDKLLPPDSPRRYQVAPNYDAPFE